jgi:tetratricopeptide (TPR) repeat protein
VTGATVVAVVLGVPALAFLLWPLLRRGAGRVALLPLPPDEREQWHEARRAGLRALRELAFEHDAGHISDADYAELRARYEQDVAAALTRLDELGATATTRAPVERPAGERTTAARGWRHPVALGASAVALLVFGVLLGVGIVRYTEPQPTAAPDARVAAAPQAPAMEGAPGRPIPPEVMRGMLDAARNSLAEGRYSEAIAAYQAVLKRDPKNVDAMTHLGLIVAIGGHADSALEAFDKALALQPDYPPALLYRGQVLYEAKKDVEGAVRAWERFVKVAPSEEDRARVRTLIAEAKAGSRK